MKTDSHVRLVLASNLLTDNPEAGGHWSCFLQYPLGLAALGHTFLWVELYRPCGNAARDQFLIEQFFARMGEYGLREHCVLLAWSRQEISLTLKTAQIYGKSKLETQSSFAGADLLWNFIGALKAPLLSRFQRRVYIDGDPGVFQVSALECDLGQKDHQWFLTVGCKLGDADCQVPTLGLTWHRFPQFVHLPLWRVAADPGAGASFTSVTQW